MSDTSDTNDSSRSDFGPASRPPQPPTRPTGSRSGWRRWLMIGSLALVSVIGVGAAVRAATGFPMWGPGRAWRGASAGEWAASRAERLLHGIDATPDQETKIKAVITAALRDLEPTRATFRDTRGELVKILAAGQIDRAAAERLRSERIALADQVSKRMVDAVLDVAEVLTPEQRAKLQDRMAERGRRGPF